MRGATERHRYGDSIHCISIHAPRAGSDHAHDSPVRAIVNFNPRSPCGERPVMWIMVAPPVRFQSTLPVRGATRNTHTDTSDQLISIHAPRAGSDIAHLLQLANLRDFNPRSPCGERLTRNYTSPAINQFQSTLPVRGATQVLAASQGKQSISIHAPRAGSDDRPATLPGVPMNFNPRSPCGERLMAIEGIEKDFKFQSTLPVRGATFLLAELTRCLEISIHAPRAGSDSRESSV